MHQVICYRKKKKLYYVLIETTFKTDSKKDPL